jgi:NAD(P)-dependent dehydrogenase (short-subunit alcohol dehydrogenase family)
VNLSGGFDSERRRKDFMLSKTLVVAGAGPGLGLEIARRFGREGFNVALLARRLESLDGLVTRLREEGIRAEGFVADIGDETALKHAFAAVRQRFGRIDVLEFSPVPAPEGDADKYSPLTLDRATMDRLHRVQILGAVTCVQEVLPEMLERGDGAIFLTTSGSALHVMPVYTPVGMVMAGLRSYALCLNEVLAKKGVYAATVCIAVLIRKDDPAGDPARIADVYFNMYSTRNRAEQVIYAGNDLNVLHDQDMGQRGVAWERPQ